MYPNTVRFLTALIRFVCLSVSRRAGDSGVISKNSEFQRPFDSDGSSLENVTGVVLQHVHVPYYSPTSDATNSLHTCMTVGIPDSFEERTEERVSRSPVVFGIIFKSSEFKHPTIPRLHDCNAWRALSHNMYRITVPTYSVFFPFTSKHPSYTVTSNHPAYLRWLVLCDYEVVNAVVPATAIALPLVQEKCARLWNHASLSWRALSPKFLSMWKSKTQSYNHKLLELEEIIWMRCLRFEICIDYYILDMFRFHGFKVRHIGNQRLQVVPARTGSAQRRL